MMKHLIIAGFALGTLLLSSPSQAQPARCLPPEFIIAKARAERPNTEVLARHTGSEAAALLGAISSFTEDADEDEDASDADEITVLRSSHSDEVLVIVAEEGCMLWRAQFSRSDYEHATWKAFGLPI